MTPEELFQVHFLPLYPSDVREDLVRARATDANPSQNPTIVAHLDEAATLFAKNAPSLFDTDLLLDRSDASVHRLSALVTPDRRDRWIADGVLVNAVIHGAAYVGECIVAQHGARWNARRPLWESLVRLTSDAGIADLAVFHWWLKALSTDVGIAERYRAHVEVPRTRTEAIAVLASSRDLPRIAKGPVRYDTLHKYLKAHLPELKDVGPHFPPPERFHEFGFRYLDFALVGGGRMLVMSGPGANGLHLIWLTASGFEKAAFFPFDASPEPRVAIEDEGQRITVSGTVNGAQFESQMLWWGP